MRLLIQQAETALGRRDVRVRGRRIESIASGLAPRRRERVIDGRDFAALPGLINAHDHLSLNLLPHLGAPPYPNIYAFADDVYRPEAPPLDPIQTATSTADRLIWGAYKNLISGVTTVVHHDPFSRRVLGRSCPIKVLRRYAWSHSLRFGPDPSTTYRRDRPFIIHAAEGIEGVETEIDDLDALGVLAPNTAIVHAIAVDGRQRQRLAARHVGVVWCPYSNQRLYGDTADVEGLIDVGITVALGTDSTISGAPTLLDEARAAESTGRASRREILAMVTRRGAALFGLGDGRGLLVEGGPADLVLLPADGGGTADSLLTSQPGDIALVLVDGQPRRAAASLVERLGVDAPNVWIDGEAAWLWGDIVGLKERLRAAAGDSALDAGPLWRRVIPSSTRRAA